MDLEYTATASMLGYAGIAITGGTVTSLMASWLYSPPKGLHLPLLSVLRVVLGTHVLWGLILTLGHVAYSCIHQIDTIHMVICSVPWLFSTIGLLLYLLLYGSLLHWVLGKELHRREETSVQNHSFRYLLGGTVSAAIGWFLAVLIVSVTF